jgi:endonuclease-3
MNKKETNKIINILRETYPEAKCSLNFDTPFQLVVAVMLSAQCTDERVNLTTPSLFEHCKTIEDFANIDLKELEKLIHPCGFYRNKAKNIKLCANQILKDFNGTVPSDMNSLLSLAGVGRKSANVIQLEVFGIANGIAVDTHCKRLSNRLGLSSQSDPNKIEQDLLKQIDKSNLKDVNHLFIWHGRYICSSRKPNCAKCTIKEFCKYYNNSVN